MGSRLDPVGRKGKRVASEPGVISGRRGAADYAKLANGLAHAGFKRGATAVAAAAETTLLYPPLLPGLFRSLWVLPQPPPYPGSHETRHSSPMTAKKSARNQSETPTRPRNSGRSARSVTRSTPTQRRRYKRVLETVKGTLKTTKLSKPRISSQ